MPPLHLKNIFNYFTDVLFPRFCVGCGREGLYICKDCEVFLSETCPEPAEGVVSVWEYEGLMEKLIHKIKFDGCYDMIGELVEKALGKIDLRLPEDSVITFVPMWPKKERQRGFNTAELIARKLAVYLPRVNDVHPREVHALLEKIKDNRSQVGLGPKERQENVKGAFCALKPSFNGEKLGFVDNVLLVDDVYTTGATMNECKKVLKKAGIKNIWGFTLARKTSIQNY